jgi:tripartite-type tricarboxylate transporter receptor subunit TctC
MHHHTTPPSRIRRALLAATAAGAALVAVPAAAQDGPFPSKPIRIMVPTPPGGNHDALGRLLASKLAETWGQQVIVENKPGANTIVATKAVAQSPADGYTALFTLSGFVQNIALRADAPYKMEDLAPVSLIATYPIALAANVALEANDLPGLVKLAKAAPGKYSFGSYGMGSGGHVIGAGLNKAAGIDIRHVAYKGEAASFPDLVNGDIALAYGSVGFYANQLAGGKVKILAVANPHRLKRFPDVPTFAEAGFADVNLPGWGAMFLPGGTPAPIVERYAQAMQAIVRLPDVQERIYSMGFEPLGSSPIEFAQQLREDVERWSRIARESNIQLE